MEEQKTQVELTPARNVLIVHRNNFQKQLLNVLIDLKRHLIIQDSNPDFTRPSKDPKKKPISISEIVKNYQEGVENTKSYLEIIDDLLAKDEAGNLPKEWGAEESEKKENDQQEAKLNN